MSQQNSDWKQCDVRLSCILIEDHSHGTADDIDTPVAKRRLHSKGPIIIEDNVWIGENACILENVRIGKCSIIGANAVVTHDIPPYSVAVGVPAKVVNTIRSGNLVASEKQTILPCSLTLIYP